MKQVLPILFLFLLGFLHPKSVFSAISFTINNPIREGDYFIIDASISGISSSSAFVQGMFTATDSTSYFGYTWGQNEEWVNFVSNTNKSFITQNLPILQKNVTQKIWVKPNYGDSAYKGPGNYFLKLERFTGASDSSAGDPAVLTVTLTEPLSTPTPTVTEEPTNSPNPTSIWTPNPTKTPTPTVKKSPTPTIKSANQATYSAVLGDSTDSANVIGSESAAISNIRDINTVTSETKIKKPINYKLPFFIGLLAAVFSGALLYFRLRKD